MRDLRAEIGLTVWFISEVKPTLLKSQSNLAVPWFLELFPYTLSHYLSEPAFQLGSSLYKNFKLKTSSAI